MDDKEANQQDQNHPSLLPKNHNTTNTNTITAREESLIRKANIGGGGGGGGGGNSDRLKRDEWSEGAVSILLEAYEAKWVLRNRAKLKGHDWEDVARCVSSRANNTKSPKTQTQCKNKIESMKKRYRSESATADVASSSWPLYSRLDVLLRGTGPISSVVAQPSTTSAVAVAAAAPAPATSQSLHIPSNNQPLMLLEPSPAVSQPPHQPPPPPVAPQPLANVQNSHGSNGVDRLAKEDRLGTKSSDDNASQKNPLDTDSSTPALYIEKDKLRCNKRRRKEEMEIAESIRWLAEVVVRSEQTRMDTMKEIERMRVEAEAKRGELDLKRTEIIANTQLEIAKIFASANNKGVDSSLRIGRT